MPAERPSCCRSAPRWCWCTGQRRHGPRPPMPAPRRPQKPQTPQRRGRDKGRSGGGEATLRPGGAPAMQSLAAQPREPPGRAGAGGPGARGVLAARHHPPRPPATTNAGSRWAERARLAGLWEPGCEPSFVPGLAVGGSWKVPSCHLLTQVPLAFTLCTITDPEILCCKGQAQRLGEEAAVAS